MLEAARLRQRTTFDLEMLRELGYCTGVENYSRHLARREAGSRPWTLLDYFPPDWLLVVDESHMTIPQVVGMYKNDRTRKEILVDFGFRLPSALDNRPLTFEEFEATVNQAVYMSATPGPYELERSKGNIAQQLIRPTGVVDPQITVRPTESQIDDLLEEIRGRVERGERALVTTLTKKMAEDLTDYLKELGVKVQYLHSEVDTLERVAILRDLRLGVFDVLVGINLLREGIDLPGGDARRDPRRRQGGLPPFGLVADPDDRACRAQRRRRGRHVCRPRDRVDAGRHGRDEPPARDPGRLQHGARHRADHDRQGDPRHQRAPAIGRRVGHRLHLGARRVGARLRRGGPQEGRGPGRADGGRDAPGGQGARVRACRRVARRDPEHPAAGPGAGCVGDRRARSGAGSRDGGRRGSRWPDGRSGSCAWPAGRRGRGSRRAGHGGDERHRALRGGGAVRDTRRRARRRRHRVRLAAGDPRRARRFPGGSGRWIERPTWDRAVTPNIRKRTGQRPSRRRR